MDPTLNPSLQSPQLIEQLSHLVLVSWIVLIPVGVLLAMVLYKLAMLMHSLSEFLVLARHELSPTLQDVRKTAHHVELITSKAAVSVNTVEQGMQAVGPAMNRGVRRLRHVPNDIKTGILALFSGLRASFSKDSKAY